MVGQNSINVLQWRCHISLSKLVKGKYSCMCLQLGSLGRPHIEIKESSHAVV